MSEPKVKWIPIMWEKEYIGFCPDDLKETETGVTEGKWIEIKHNGNAIAAEVIEVQENKNWRDHLVWIPRQQREKL